MGTVVLDMTLSLSLGPTGRGRFWPGTGVTPVLSTNAPLERAWSRGHIYLLGNLGNGV